jgi:hypothetical protein
MTSGAPDGPPGSEDEWLTETLRLFHLPTHTTYGPRYHRGPGRLGRLFREHLRHTRHPRSSASSGVIGCMGSFANTS